MKTTLKRRLTAFCFWLCIDLSLIGNLFAEQDPFDKNSRIRHEPHNDQSKPHTEIQSENLTTPCYLGETIAEHIAFKDLKPIAVLQQQDKTWIAFFLSPTQSIIPLQINEVIAQEHLQLTNVSKQKLQFLQLENTQNCQQPKIVKLNF